MAERTPVVVLGAGGHAAVVVDVIRNAEGFSVGGVCSDRLDLRGTDVLGHSVGALDDFPGHWPVVVAVGENELRARLVSELALLGRMFAAPLVHSRACVARDVSVGPGTVIMAGAVVNPRTALGRHVIVNTAASIDHDCNLGDFCHISPGARLAGCVSVGAFSLVGTGASVIPGIRIGARAAVGAGAVVVREVPDAVVVAGNPARVLRGS